MHLVAKPSSPVYRCKKCNEILYSRRKRGLLIKTFLFWLPVKKFFCDRCLKMRYHF
jgi:hypothetical protein